jgi:hypothetical protein
LSSRVKSSLLFLIFLIVTEIRDSNTSSYYMQYLKLIAIISIEMYEKRFSKLKEIDPGKNKIIKISCLDNC